MKKTLFNDLKFGKSKTLLFCCNGYSHAIFFFFLWISSRTTKKINYKRFLEKIIFNKFFIAVLLHFYDLKYQN